MKEKSIKNNSFFCKQVHIFKRGELWIAYGINTRQIFILEEKEATLLQLYKDGFDVDEISRELHIETKKVIDYLNEITEKLNNCKVELIDYLPINSFYLKFIEKCNVSCSYCYINHQKYNRSIDTNLALKAVEVMVDLGAKGIGIHGGEHLLEAKKLMDFISTIRERSIPIEIGISINGTLVTEEIAYLFKKYNVIVSVGIDGSKISHDKTRIYHDGSSTYDDVINGVKILKKYGVLAAIELTISTKHDEPILKMIKNIPNFNVPITVSRVRAAEGKPYVNEVHRGNKLKQFLHEDLKLISMCQNCITYSKANLIKLSMNANKCSQYMCNEILDRVSVDIDGEVYPCPKVKDECTSIGNVMDINFKKDFEIKRKQKMNWFSRDKVEEFWFYRLLNVCVDTAIFNSDGKWAIEECEILGEYFEDIIYERINMDEKEIINIVDKWKESGF